jgi:hypothetical protein
MTLEELRQKYEIILAHKEMEIAQMTLDAILHLKYLVALQDDLRRAGIKPSQNRREIEKIITDEYSNCD